MKGWVAAAKRDTQHIAWVLVRGRAHTLCGKSIDNPKHALLEGPRCAVCQRIDDEAAA